jgi:archaellum component FlaC
VPGLLLENKKLSGELTEEQRRYSVERQAMESKLSSLEERNEELQHQLNTADQGKRTITGGYEQRIETLKKQLRSNKAFLEVIFACVQFNPVSILHGANCHKVKQQNKQEIQGRENIHTSRFYGHFHE